MAKVKSEFVWGALHAIGSEDGTADTIPPEVMGKLIEHKIATVNATGLPELTEYGRHAYNVMESGDGEIDEMEDVWC